jgi:hypothetical protein
LKKRKEVLKYEMEMEKKKGRKRETCREEEERSEETNKRREKRGERQRKRFERGEKSAVTRERMKKVGTPLGNRRLCPFERFSACVS